MTKGTSLPWSPRASKPRPISTHDKLQKEVDRFNNQFPVGTKVEYWRGIREGEGKIGFIKSRAEILSGHTPVVWIAGCSGCIALSHVRPLDKPVDGAKATVGDFLESDED